MLDYDMAAHGSESLYGYLYQRIRDDIVEGEIAAGSRLPSKRSLAEHLGVSVATVEGAYGQLVAEGYVSARARSGYYACDLPGMVAYVASPQVDAVVHASGDSQTDLSRPAGASLDAARLWSRALRQTLTCEPEEEVFCPAPAQGTLRLRRAIAAHLRQTRGLVVDPARIVVGAGAQMLDVMIAQLMGQASVFALEDPGYVRLTRIYEACGCGVRHVPLDGQGVQMAGLEASGANVLHLMPSHQFPTGLVTSISRRYELMGWASVQEGRWLVEDDYDCEFRLAGRPVPALASIDADGRVIYTNTFSKSLGAALRLAYMVLPEELMERYSRELGFYSSTVSSVQQVALARILEGGDYERHVARVRKRCRDLRDELVGALRARPDAGRIGVEQADAGLHLVLRVDTKASEEEIAVRAVAAGLPEACLVPLSRYAFERADGDRSGAARRFVVPYDALDPTRVAILASLAFDEPSLK